MAISIIIYDEYVCDRVAREWLDGVYVNQRWRCMKKVIFKFMWQMLSPGIAFICL